MAIGDVEVVFRDGHWFVQFQGRYRTQGEAWEVAQEIGRRLGRESFLRSLTGRWRERNTYPRQRDPGESKG